MKWGDIMFLNSDLKDRFRIMGYETGSELIELDNDLLEICNLLRNKSFNLKNNFWYCSKKRIINEAKNAIDSLFILHDIKYLPQSSIESFPHMFNVNLFDSDEFLNMEYDGDVFISPYKLPIMFGNSSKLRQAAIGDNIYSYAISLEKKHSKIILLEYIHGIFHTQMDSHKGIIKDYMNREVISIFMEKLMSLEIDKSEIVGYNLNNIRLQNLYDCIKYQSKEVSSIFKLEACVYIVSTLKADMLFNIYINSSNFVRLEMLKDIQSVMDGNLCLEELLCKYDVTYERSKNVDSFKKILRK